MVSGEVGKVAAFGSVWLKVWFGLLGHGNDSMMRYGYGQRREQVIQKYSAMLQPNLAF